MAIDMIKAELSSAHDEPRAAAAEYVSIAAQELAESKHPFQPDAQCKLSGTMRPLMRCIEREAAPVNESTAALSRNRLETG